MERPKDAAQAMINTLPKAAFYGSAFGALIGSSIEDTLNLAQSYAPQGDVVSWLAAAAGAFIASRAYASHQKNCSTQSPFVPTPRAYSRFEKIGDELCQVAGAGLGAAGIGSVMEDLANVSATNQPYLEYTSAFFGVLVSAVVTKQIISGYKLRQLKQPAHRNL